ncbi:MAG TPA: glutamate racemase [Candidatus Margulisiibacteriota bacterium]|nr:glutamate racemase [Candidatus Margulisiibacteriota bacterium]
MKSTPRSSPRRPNGASAAKRAEAAAAAAIGIFDSGIGGLTVMREIMAMLPHEHLIYLGDTGRYPYGSKSADTVRRYSIENAAFLAEKGIKMLVVACNTSAAVALDVLSEQLKMPVLGVIEPGARAAVKRTRNRKVGVIGTEGTIASGAYTRALKRLDSQLEIYTRACPLFVPLAEEGWVNNAVARGAAALYLTSLKRSGIDTLVLGCTHYPLLADVIAEFMDDKVCLVDSARTTAEAIRDTLVRYGLLQRSGPGSASFFVTDATDRFTKVAARFMGHPVESAVRIER